MGTSSATVTPGGLLPPGATLYLVMEMAECPPTASGLLQQLRDAGFSLDDEVHAPVLSALRHAGARVFLPLCRPGATQDTRAALDDRGRA